MVNKINYYSRQGLWSLFLMCAFPIHLWAMLMVFNDVGWVAKRTNAWDAIGLASYGLVFAFIESVLFFLVIALLGSLVSTKWEQNRRLALMSTLALIASLWGMISQIYFLQDISLPATWLFPLTQMAHPVRFMYAVGFVIILPTVLVPACFILQSEKTVRFIMDAIERISLLTAFYLFFDLIGLVIVIIRNMD